MHYRQRLTDWQARGWHMDVETLTKNRGRVAYAVPSPARRADPTDWAVTPVPMLAGEHSRQDADRRQTTQHSTNQAGA
jgi:hypothetical protein